MTFYDLLALFLFAWPAFLIKNSSLCFSFLKYDDKYMVLLILIESKEFCFLDYENDGDELLIG